MKTYFGFGISLLLLLFATLIPASADSDAGILTFKDKDMAVVQTLSVQYISIDEINRYVGLLDNQKGNALALAVWNNYWEPTFYVGSIPDTAKYVDWTYGYTTYEYIMIKGVQTNLSKKLYVPAKEEVGLMARGYDCESYMFCLAALNDW